MTEVELPTLDDKEKGLFKRENLFVQEEVLAEYMKGSPLATIFFRHAEVKP